MGEYPGDSSDQEGIYATMPTDAGGAENLILVGIVIMAITLYFVRQRDRFQRESGDLLYNILPEEIAVRLKAQGTMIADDFPEASVLFADVVGFTPMSATMRPAELVGLLNWVLSVFDGFVADLGLEKIKTVGDEYMVASGVPVPRSDHVEAIAELALRIRDHVANEDFDGHRLRLRIRITCGAVVAGVIGTHKFSYDLWGDTVNVASRMESGGLPGEIQTTPQVRNLLSHRYVLESRGHLEVKGLGQMEAFILPSRKAGYELRVLEVQRRRSVNWNLLDSNAIRRVSSGCEHQRFAPGPRNRTRSISGARAVGSPAGG
jgi:guanylate cyclase